MPDIHSSSANTKERLFHSTTGLSEFDSFRANISNVPQDTTNEAFELNREALSNDTYFERVRHHLIERLSQLVEGKYGIRCSRQVKYKLARILRSSTNIGLTQWLDQLEALDSSDPEWLALIENLTVHETYFFRDAHQMGTIKNEILPRLIQTAAKDPVPRLRILSAACSTGEEVYSLVMLVLETLLKAKYACYTANGEISINPNWQVEVIGVDISASVLNQAKTAHYSLGSKAFVQLPSEWKNYFEETPFETPSPGKSHAYENPHESPHRSERYLRPKAFIKNLARFIQHNLLTPFPVHEKFDLILCRNALIYFNDNNVRKTQSLLSDALKKNGALMFGVTDRMLIPANLSRQCAENRQFYYTKRNN